MPELHIAVAFLWSLYLIQQGIVTLGTAITFEVWMGNVFVGFLEILCLAIPPTPSPPPPIPTPAIVNGVERQDGSVQTVLPLVPLVSQTRANMQLHNRDLTLINMKSACNRRFHGRGRHLGSGANAAKFTVNVWENSWFWCSITRGSLTFYSFYELQTKNTS